MPFAIRTIATVTRKGSHFVINYDNKLYNDFVLNKTILLAILAPLHSQMEMKINNKESSFVDLFVSLFGSWLTGGVRTARSTSTCV